MIALVLALTIAVALSKSSIAPYLLPLGVAGMGLALFHNLLYWGVITEGEGAACRIGVSCTEKYIEWFGFITIPFLSLVAFSAVTFLLFLAYKYSDSL
jgi:disulfide bond formation protein DsbB